MAERERWSDFLWAGGLASIAVVLVVSVGGGWGLHVIFGDSFPELSFPLLTGYLAGRLIVPLLAVGLLLAALGGVLARLTGPRRTHPRKLPVLFALLLSGLLAGGLVFWLNSNLLRYSRDLRSYALDVAMLLAAAVFGLLLVRLLPRTHLERRRGARVLGLLLLAGMLALRAIGNPFAAERFLPAAPPAADAPQRTGRYTAEGRYVGAEDLESEQPWNILLLSIDTLRADGLHAYGNRRDTSPRIDSLAARGVCFDRVLALSSWTLPSHMTMVTGLQPSVHGCSASPMWTRTFDALSPRWVTLAEVLRGWGYDTAAFTDGRLVGPTFGFDQGFDICDDSGHGIERIAEKAIDWLDRDPQEPPFFLFLHCYDVHHYRPPEKFAQRYVTERPARMAALRRQGKELEARLNANAFYHLDPAEIAYVRALYDAEIRKTDAAFGGVLEALRQRGLAEETIVIVTSDHGEEFWEHGGTGHGWSLHQHQLRVPLIFCGPGIGPPGRRDPGWVGLADLMPTILDLLGLPVPAQVQGLSFSGRLRGAETASAMPRTFLAEASHLGNQKCLVADGHAYLFHRYPPIGEDLFDWRRAIFVWRNVLHALAPEELYDLTRDPGERENLAARDPQRAGRMRQRLLALTRQNLVRAAMQPEQGRQELDEEVRDHLRSLGYID
ncbi:MAG: sulfatase-like hydrolase/transferase [Candidatus Eisenbacteria bacterium]|nr:sulfatase-like hydrolase/transferase [Candidatus Eisenbacteria bacterium]